MGMAVHIPEMRDIFLFQISVHALANADEPIFIATREVEQLELGFRRTCIGDELLGTLGVRRRRKPTDPGKRLQMPQSKVKRLPTAHREPRNASALTV